MGGDDSELDITIKTTEEKISILRRAMIDAGLKDIGWQQYEEKPYHFSSYPLNDLAEFSFEFAEGVDVLLCFRDQGGWKMPHWLLLDHQNRRLYDIEKVRMHDLPDRVVFQTCWLDSFFLTPEEAKQDHDLRLSRMEAERGL